MEDVDDIEEGNGPAAGAPFAPTDPLQPLTLLVFCVGVCVCVCVCVCVRGLCRLFWFFYFFFFLVFFFFHFWCFLRSNEFGHLMFALSIRTLRRLHRCWLSVPMAAFIKRLTPRMVFRFGHRLVAGWTWNKLWDWNRRVWSRIWSSAGTAGTFRRTKSHFCLFACL